MFGGRSLFLGRKNDTKGEIAEILLFFIFIDFLVSVKKHYFLLLLVLWRCLKVDFEILTGPVVYRPTVNHVSLSV